MKRIFGPARWVAIAALVGVMSACTGSDGGAEGDASKLKAGSLLQPSSLDPVNVTGGHDMTFLRLIYDRLLEVDAETGQVKEGLATEWGYSEDKKTFTLKLREGVKFSDGTPVDAEAVKANLDRNFKLTKLGLITSVDSVEVVSPTELKLTLGEDSAWLAEQLAHNSGYMVSPKAFEASGDDVSGNPIGSGPYVIKTNVSGSQIVFEKNDDYWNDDRGFYESIDLKFFKTPVSMNQALQSGQIDVAARTALTDIDTLKKADGIEVEVDPSLAHYHVQFNMASPKLEDKRVRDAFNFALDREALAKAATGGYGEPTQSMYPSSSEYSSDETQSLYTYDPAKAKQLLADAGFADGIELKCSTYTGSGYETSSPYILEQLEAVGIKVDLEISELTEVMANFYKGGDMAAAAKAPDCNFTSWPSQPTPRDTFNAEYGKSIYNVGHAEVVPWEMLADFETTLDPDERVTKAQAIQVEAANNPNMANMYTKPKAYAHRTNVEPHEPNLLEFDIDMAALKPAE
ncbi:MULTISPECIES: ABC transporter substrate-binding protein [Aeromicrobium]|uniref:ABC transporter substrate-binding protein n=1 Tax=Aeromicrobium TaxID=2040 RepID=UPI002579B4E4|nr:MULTISPECIES: ABC transporter substrate-binding protein [Aeromicrobium]